MRFIPASIATYATFKGTTHVWANPSSDPATYATETGNCIRQLNGLSTRKGHRAGYWHEPVSDVAAGTYTVAEWVQANINFKHDVIDVVNASRPANAPIWCAPCNNGFPSNAIQDTYYPNTLLAVIDEINWDLYGFAGSDSIQRLHDYATAKGMPWSVGELGYSVSPGNTDLQELGLMQLLSSHIASWPVSERPGFVSWFNAGNNALAGDPQSSAYWKNLCVNASVQPA
jgi:hypothetical protein